MGRTEKFGESAEIMHKGTNAHDEPVHDIYYVTMCLLIKRWLRRKNKGIAAILL